MQKSEMFVWKVQPADFNLSGSSDWVLMQVNIQAGETL